MKKPKSIKKRSELSLNQLLPNLVTIAAICAGLTSIRFGFQGNYPLAVQLILLACILDGVDGRIARLMNSESALGAELDSLADFLNFGVAPSLLIYTWAFQDIRNEGWIAVVIYVVCCVMRLARFNTASKSEMTGGSKSETTDERRDYFVGVPAPAGAFLAMLPLFYSFIWGNGPALPSGVIVITTVLAGLLMISRIPTYSPKSMIIKRAYVKFFMLGFVGVLAAFFSYPWETLVGLGCFYLVSILWTWRASRRI
jgi:CDP-diacylglycerol---serine O-phosphatidyltransferase